MTELGDGPSTHARGSAAHTAMRPAPRRKRRARRWLLRLGLVATSCALALVGLELYLRATTADLFAAVTNLRGLYEVDDEGWARPVPGHVMEVVLHGRTTTAHLNGLGLRGAEVPDRAPREKRVLTIGDSMVFGYGVDDDETFTALLQQKLAAALGCPVVARSGGAPDYGTVDQVHVLRHVQAAFAPDLIVSGLFLGNDFADNFVDARTVVDGYMLSGPIAKVAQGSLRTRLALRFRVCFELEHWLRQNQLPLALALPAPEANALATFGGKIAMGLFMDAVEETPAHAAVLDRTVEALAAVAAKAHPIPMLVVLLPCPMRASAAAYARELQAQGWSPDTHDAGTVQRRLAQRCAALGLTVVDLTPAFAMQAQPAALFLGPDFHYSAAGHRLVAEQLAPQIAARLR